MCGAGGGEHTTHFSFLGYHRHRGRPSDIGYAKPQGVVYKGQPTTSMSTSPSRLPLPLQHCLYQADMEEQFISLC